MACDTSKVCDDGRPNPVWDNAAPKPDVQWLIDPEDPILWSKPPVYDWPAHPSISRRLP
jgi:hypothetical protein